MQPVMLDAAGRRRSPATADPPTVDPRRGSILVRCGWGGGKRREVGMDAGPGNDSRPGLSCAGRRSSARCCVSTGRPAVGRRQRPPRAHSCGASRPAQGAPTVLRRISCGMPTPWRLHAKESHRCHLAPARSRQPGDRRERRSVDLSRRGRQRLSAWLHVRLGEVDLDVAAEPEPLAQARFDSCLVSGRAAGIGAKPA